MGNVLEIEGVDQSFRVGFWLKNKKVLDSITLKISSNSVFGFLGANGAGKTTLIHLITGLRTPTRGSVRVFGFDASSREAKVRMGYVPERPYFYRHLTGECLLRYYGVLSGLGDSQIKDRIPKVLADVGMLEARHIELKKYSKGMLQRIGIAQALIHDPEFLVMDEPMSGLDPVGRKEIRELIFRLANEGRTLFFSSHVIPDVEAVCDQVGIIDKGKLVGCGPIDQFLAKGPIQSEIAFKGFKYEDCKDWGEFEKLRDLPDALHGIVRGQEAVNQVVARILKDKGTLLWVTPIQPSLEQFFKKEG